MYHRYWDAPVSVLFPRDYWNPTSETFYFDKATLKDFLQRNVWQHTWHVVNESKYHDDTSNQEVSNGQRDEKKIAKFPQRVLRGNSYADQHVASDRHHNHHGEKHSCRNKETTFLLDLCQFLSPMTACSVNCAAAIRREQDRLALPLIYSLPPRSTREKHEKERERSVGGCNFFCCI